MRPPRVRFTVGRLMVLVALGGLMLGVSEWLARPSRYNDRCQANLRAIGMALQRYQADHGSYPPAFVADAAGRPIHSWRALLLPYLDEPALARAYRRDEPWDGPHNAQLAGLVPEAYRCPAHAAWGCSSYAVVVGPGTAWPGPVGITAARITDGTAILAVELEGGIPWLEPRDLTAVPPILGPDYLQNRALANRDLAELRRQGLAATRFHPRGMNWLKAPLAVEGRRYGENSGEVFRAELTIAGAEIWCVEEAY